MSLLPTVLSVVLAAFAVWLGVRIVNRRERWAKWTAVALTALLVAYPLSFGPAVLLSRRGQLGRSAEELLTWFYLPLAVVTPFLPEPLRGWFDAYIDLCR